MQEKRQSRSFSYQWRLNEFSYEDSMLEHAANSSITNLALNHPNHTEEFLDLNEECFQLIISMLTEGDYLTDHQKKVCRLMIKHECNQPDVVRELQDSYDITGNSVITKSLHGNTRLTSKYGKQSKSGKITYTIFGNSWYQQKMGYGKKDGGIFRKLCQILKYSEEFRLLIKRMDGIIND